MKKMIVSAIVCLVLVMGAAIAYCCYMDALAIVLFVSGLVPSCLFEQARQEHRKAVR